LETILSKQEIEDLLQAIKEGRISTDIGLESRDAFSKPCTPLNLFNVNALHNELSRVPNLDIILDNFCQNYAITLTNQLQRTFSITRTGIDSSHFLDFLLENKDAGAIGVLDISPLKQGALLLLDTQLCFTMIEIMLGASAELDHLQLDRKLTKIELSIIQSILHKGCDDLDRAFAPLIELKSTVLKVESNSRLVSITDSDAEILIGAFKVSVGEVSGEIKLVIPLSTIEPLRDSLKDLLNVNKSKQGLWSNILKENVAEIYTDLIAQSGEITLSVNDILALEEGDILQLDYNPNAPLHVLIGNHKKFSAIPGTHNGKKAINITGVHNQGA
jgi:flagellar motor switch protein FliM